jgi:hypothetical protein
MPLKCDALMFHRVCGYKHQNYTPLWSRCDSSLNAVTGERPRGLSRLPSTFVYRLNKPRRRRSLVTWMAVGLLIAPANVESRWIRFVRSAVTHSSHKLYIFYEGEALCRCPLKFLAFQKGCDCWISFSTVTSSNNHVGCR